MHVLSLGPVSNLCIPNWRITGELGISPVPELGVPLPGELQVLPWGDGWSPCAHPVPYKGHRDQAGGGPITWRPSGSW